jgi:hypothetical protein
MQPLLLLLLLVMLSSAGIDSLQTGCLRPSRPASASSTVGVRC